MNVFRLVGREKKEGERVTGGRWKKEEGNVEREKGVGKREGYNLGKEEGT